MTPLGQSVSEATWPNGVPKISDERRAENLASAAALRGLIATFWLYHGRYVETQLTTEQKELYADVVEHEHEAGDEYAFERWWRE